MVRSTLFAFMLILGLAPARTQTFSISVNFKELGKPGIRSDGIAYVPLREFCQAMGLKFYTRPGGDKVEFVLPIKPPAYRTIPGALSSEARKILASDAETWLRQSEALLSLVDPASIKPVRLDDAAILRRDSVRSALTKSISRIPFALDSLKTIRQRNSIAAVAQIQADISAISLALRSVYEAPADEERSVRVEISPELRTKILVHEIGALPLSQKFTSYLHSLCHWFEQSGLNPDY